MLVKRTRSTTKNWTTSSFGVHRYKKEMQPGKKKTKKEKNHLTLNKQTMKHNATVEKYKANNVITRWSLQGDITLLCD